MKHLKLFFALFAMLALGVGNAWAEEVYFEGFEENHRTSGNNSYTASAKTYGDWTLTYADAVTSGSPLTGTAHVIMRVAKNTTNSPSLVSKALLSDNVSVTKVSWNCKGNTAQTLKVSYSTDGSNWVEKYSASLGSKANKSFTLDNIPGPIYLKFVVSVATSTGSNRDANIDDITIEGTSSGSGNEETAVSVPTFSVPEGTFYSPINVELSCSTADAEIYYTLDGNTPSSTSEKYTTAIAISETTTIKAIAVKDGLTDSEVATATYTKGETVTSYDIDFETNALEAYVNWDFSNITITTATIQAKGGTYYGNTSGKASAYIKTKEKIQYPGILTFSVSKESTNTTASNWLVQVSENGTTWSTVSTISATEMTKGNWNDHSVDLSDYENVYVQISYGSSTAVRAIDEISLAQGVAPVKYTLTIENPENGTLSVTKGGVSVASGDQFKAGTSLVVTPTPASGYLFESLTVDGSEVELSEGKYTFTMPENDVIISATFKENEKPSATLTLSKNGETELLPGNHKQDDVVTLPDFESDCSKTFVGWSENQNCNTEPEYKAGDSYQLKLEGNQTLYAVYADGEEGGVTTIKYSGSTTNMSSNNDAQTLGLDESEWTVVGEKGGASNNVGLNTNGEFRLYYHANGGNTLTITAPKTIATVVLSLKTNYDNAWVKVDGNIVEPIDGVYEINANTFVIGNANTSNVQVHILQIDVTLAGNYSNYSTTCAAAPKAEVTPTEVTATAAGVEGKVTVTYENVNTENVAVALFNDEACTETFTAGWLTASIDADKNITYTVAENTTYAERKAYIQLTAPETTGATDPAVVVIPVTQVAKDKVFASLEELVAADLIAGDEVTVTLNNDVIKEFYIYSSKRCGVVFDVQKDGKDIKIYFNSQTTIDDWAVGGKLSGTLTNVKWTTYSSAWQLAPANTWAWANLTYTEPKAVSTVVVSGAPTKTTYVDGEAFDPAGLTVTVNYNDATTEVNPTGVTFTVTPTTLVKGQTSVSVTATFNSVTSAAYEVTGLTVNDIPTKTVAEFIAAGGTRCYLEGIVSNITNTTYGNFDLTDASGTIYVYGCLNEAGEEQKFVALGVKNGDKIKVIAEDYELFGGTKEEAKNVQYVSHVSAASITISDITMEVDEVATITATVDPADAVVTYTIKENAANAISLSGKTITALAEGKATITATVAEGATYMGNSVDFTVTVTPESTSDEVVILAELDGKWYAMKGAVPSGKSNQLDAVEVTYFNGTLYNVPEDVKASITWTRSVVDGKATFVNNGKYLKGGTSTNLTLVATVDDACKWMWNEEDGYYTTNTSGTIRTFLYRVGYNFKNYGASQAGQEDVNGNYSELPAVTAPVYATGDIVYTRTVTNKYGTICLPYASASTSGATFFEVVGQEDGNKVYLASVDALEAGVPYIFEKTANTITVTCQGEAVANPVNEDANGLIGNFTNEYVVPDNNNYILYNNAFIPADGTTNKVNAYRAYLNLSAVEGGKPNQMPGRRYIGMSVQGENETTGVEDLFTTDAPVKVIENGQLIIIRDGVKYNVQGQKL